MIKEITDINIHFKDIEYITDSSHIIDLIKNESHHQLNLFWLSKRKYKPIWKLQKQLHELRIKKEIKDVVLLLEHDHVYTLGKNANENHILNYKDNTEIIKIDRGGDVTYHGPGQLVGYPIIDLHDYKMSINWYLGVLSKTIIDLLKELKIDSNYSDDYVGIWVDDNKIAAFGVRLAKWVTMHGFALNVNTDLSYYNGLIPCGIFEKGVTSISNQNNFDYKCLDIAKLFTKYFKENLIKRIKMKLHNFNKKELISIYEKMLMSRFLDDKMLIMLKQGKSWFHIGAAGHEAAQLAASMSFNPSLDYAYPYYRDQGFCLGWGSSARDMLMCFYIKRMIQIQEVDKCLNITVIKN